ncbi:hypothetical protein [Borrelia duttonii]
MKSGLKGKRIGNRRVKGIMMIMLDDNDVIAIRNRVDEGLKELVRY